MRLAKIVGKVVLSECHPAFDSANLKLAVPYKLENLDGSTEDLADTVVCWDELGCGHGTEIALAEGPEAAQPFRPDIKPVSAYVAAIIDDINIDKKTVKQILENK